MQLLPARIFLLWFTTVPLLLAADASAGKVAYDRECKRCHGADGAPNAAIAKALKVEMKHLADKTVLAKSDSQLAKESKDGVGKMKAQKITDAEAADIVAYIRTFPPR